MKRIVSVMTAGAFTLALGLGAAQAASVTSQVFDGFQQFSDNSAEIEIDGAGDPGILSIGDSLMGIFNIQTIEQSPNPSRNLGVGSVNELTGIFAVEVTSKVGIAGGPNVFTFGPSTAVIPQLGGLTFADWVASVGGAGGYGAGNAPMLALFDDPAQDYSRTNPGGVLGNMATAINGDLWLVLGQTGAVGEGWEAFSISDALGAVGSVPAPANGGSFTAGFNVLENYAGPLVFNGVATAYPFSGIPGGTADWFGSGSLLGILGVDTDWDVFDNVDFTTDLTIVPEPTTMVLLGSGLLGLAGISRRRKSK